VLEGAGISADTLFARRGRNGWGGRLNQEACDNVDVADGNCSMEAMLEGDGAAVDSATDRGAFGEPPVPAVVRKYHRSSDLASDAEHSFKNCSAVMASCVGREKEVAVSTRDFSWLSSGALDSPPKLILRGFRFW
jgi:hypothetical protein